MLLYIQDATVTANADELEADQLRLVAPVHKIEQKSKILQLGISATLSFGEVGHRKPALSMLRTRPDCRRIGGEIGGIWWMYY
jgi:hypothetical protein